jgi:uncharacterized membrane protein SirB2
MGFLTEHYLIIKQLHIMTAAVSILLFLIRFYLLMSTAGKRRPGWLRILPHLNDTLLLTLAILLCFSIQQAPIITPWLSEKVSAVILYIFSGMFALKWAKSRSGQVVWFIISCAMFAYTANIAMNKNPLIF